MTAMSPAPESIVPEPEVERAHDLRAWLPTIRDTALAIALALVVGAFLIIISDPEVIDALGNMFNYPSSFFVYAGDVVRYSAEAVWDAYSALVRGAVGSGPAIERTLERSAPLICAGLGVALAFRAGLFNIGAQGQALVGALAAGYVALHLGPAGGAAPAGRDRRRPARRCAVGRHRRLAQGRDRSARGDHDDHAQQRRPFRRALLPRQRVFPEAQQRQPDHARSRRQRDLPDHRGYPPRDPVGPGGGRRCVVDPGAQQAGLRTAGCRLQPGRFPDGGDEHGQGLHRW